jgi:hypothetical protein
LFICGLVVGALGAFAFVTYRDINRKKATDNIIFPMKVFSDQDATVVISGTLTGKELAYPNNSYLIICTKDEQQCLTTYVQQIGHNQMGRIEIPNSIPIRKWDAKEIVAADEVFDFTCSKTTITLSRQTQTALWVEEPVNQTRPACSRADTEIHKYTIEDSPGWKWMMEQDPNEPLLNRVCVAALVCIHQFSQNLRSGGSDPRCGPHFT